MKGEHIQDLALQKYVLEGAGLKINKTIIQHVNRECVYPDRSQLFLRADVTRHVNDVIKTVQTNIRTFKSVLSHKVPPKASIGEHCRIPYECSFKKYCWQHVNKMTIFDIPKLSKNKKLDLAQKGILSIQKLPLDYPLSYEQHTHIDRVNKGEKHIDVEGIRKKLSELTYPLYFLDFETDNPAIQRFKGLRPYQQFPFQFSCHIMRRNGMVRHAGYLHLDSSDPRKGIVKALAKCIKSSGSIIIYNASFEKSIITGLSRAFPRYSQYLYSIIARFWDQLEIFRKYYKHPAFGKSNSLKDLLPVLVPELNYGKLHIKSGVEAQSLWNHMIRTKHGPAKSRMIKDLKAYSLMDTLAMLEIHKLLQKI